MGNCRIKNIIPPCHYQPDGIASIKALDFEDFGGFRFEGDNLYDVCAVTDIVRSGDMIEIGVSNSAEYTSILQNGIYTHSIKTFINDLSADLTATLHLTSKRRYIIFFKANNGRFFSFGYESGAVLTYADQTTDGAGSLITITAKSIYPRFEVQESAFRKTKWILEEGTWNMGGTWYNDGIWKY